MNTLCRDCRFRQYFAIVVEGLYRGGCHYCNAYKRRITEVKNCKRYNLKTPLK